MKAIQVSKHAHPSTLTVSDVPAPKPGDKEVLVDVYAAGLNFFDILQSQGKYQNQPPLPFILGAEFAGRVSDRAPIPAGSKVKAGDRVLGYAQGSFGEQVAVNPATLIPIPPNCTYEQAAGIFLTYPTSYEALVGRAHAQPGEWVLVHAAAGGVGLAACQIAKVLGCRVIAAAGSDAKRAICKEKGGADYVLDYTVDGWQKEVMRITGGHGADVVFDPVGMLVPSLKCIAWNGRLVVVGFAGGAIEKVPANLILLKNVAVVGLFWGATAQRDPKRFAQVLKEVMQLIASGKLVPHTYEPVYAGLDKVPQGLQDIEDRKTWGKAIIQVRGNQAKL